MFIVVLSVMLASGQAGTVELDERFATHAECVKWTQGFAEYSNRRLLRQQITGFECRKIINRNSI